MVNPLKVFMLFDLLNCREFEDTAIQGSISEH